jgi:hypothetical protein
MPDSGTWLVVGISMVTGGKEGLGIAGLLPFAGATLDSGTWSLVGISMVTGGNEGLGIAGVIVGCSEGFGVVGLSDGSGDPVTDDGWMLGP